MRTLAALAPKPTLAVVSGLYELFADNAMVGLLAAWPMPWSPAVFLVHTGQPWHTRSWN